MARQFYKLALGGDLSFGLLFKLVFGEYHDTSVFH